MRLMDVQYPLAIKHGWFENPRLEVSTCGNHRWIRDVPVLNYLVSLRCLILGFNPGRHIYTSFWWVCDPTTTHLRTFTHVKGLKDSVHVHKVLWDVKSWAAFLGQVFIHAKVSMISSLEFKTGCLEGKPAFNRVKFWKIASRKKFVRFYLSIDHT